MAIPKVNITGQVVAPDGTVGKGDLVITLVTNKGAATVTDDTVTTTKYKVNSVPILAVITATGDVKAEDGTSTLSLVPNSLIDPLNTYYQATYTIHTNRKQIKWAEQWYLSDIDVLIGEIVPVGVNSNLTVAQQSILNDMSIVGGTLFIKDITRGGKMLSTALKSEVFTIKNLAQPQQFALHYEMVSSDSGAYIAAKYTVVGLEISSGNNHTASYSLRDLSDLGTDLFAPVVVTNVPLFKDYTLNFDLIQDTMVTVFYNPVLGQEGDNIKISLLLRERQ